MTDSKSIDIPENDSLFPFYGTSLVAQTVKCLPTMQEIWVGKMLWRRKWQPIPVLLPGKSHGWRNLVGSSPWGCKESDVTEWLHFFHFFPFYGWSMVKGIFKIKTAPLGLYGWPVCQFLLLPLLYVSGACNVFSQMKRQEGPFSLVSSTVTRISQQVFVVPSHFTPEKTG